MVLHISLYRGSEKLHRPHFRSSLLGCRRSALFPGAFYLLSCWYTKRELALRTAILYSGLVTATAFSGLLAAAIFSGLDGARGLSGWKWLFIIEGAGSFFVSLFAFFLIPDTPNESPSARSRWIKTGLNSWLFSEEECLIAKERIVRDQVSNQVSENSAWYCLRLALLDYRVWVFVSPLSPHFRKWCCELASQVNDLLTIVAVSYFVQQPHGIRFQ